MASDGSNRTHLACKFCLKTTDRLSQHLRKVCRKGASDAEIEALVEESRSKMRMLVKNLSVVNYEQLRAGADSQKSLQFFTNFLESNGCFISGKPVEADDAIQNPVTDAEEIEDEMDTEHPLLMLSTSASKISSKKVMEEAGLHKKHSDDSPLLQAFRRYLEKKYAKSGIKQEVQNVSRWLYFVNPNEASVSCIHNIERSMQFFKEIGASAASKATLRNYIGAVKKFISYVTSDPQLLEKDSSLRGSIESFLKSMMEVQRTTYKEKSVGRKATNPKECQEVLTNAHPYFVEVIDRANVKTDLEERDMTLVLFYLEALLTLQHLQKPSVLLNMTVQQWLERTRYQGHATGSVAAVIKVKAEREHIVVLQEAEEMWFDTFFRRIRPIFIKRSLKGENEIFFVSSKGQKIKNPTSDVRRFQERFDACLASGQETLDIFTKVISDSNLRDQDLIKRYLKADSSRDESSIDDYICAAIRVSELQRTWVEPSHSREGEHSGEHSAHQSEKELAYKNLEEIYPVEPDTDGPRLKECQAVSELHGRYCYDRWRRRQKQIRMDVIIAHYKHEKPTPSQVQSYLKRQGWLKHAPTVEDILLYWEASEKPKPDAMERKIQSFVKTQQWPGLAIVDDPVKGQKVVTLQDFKKGDYICDYHGPVISAKEGERLMRSVEQDEMGYLYFFLDRGNKRLCIDAQNVPCSCHSELPTTYGRKINHSRKRPNLKPMVKYFPDDTRPHILFSANKDIDVGTELLFDYGVTRKSFSGEGADLPWIDE